MLDHIWRAWSGMTDFSGASGRAEFFTYLTFAAVAGPGLAVLAFCFSSFYEFNMPHYFLNMAPFELACAVFAICQLPLFALSARRMRDAGYSPWLAVLSLVPVLGIVGIACLATRRSAHEQSGPQPGSGKLVP